ncbi:DUF1330 domain-containing protein [Bailinhaonella thermotolerans]|uniref:DUF1330 domain-containing protein n=1 Tax=Bailinhaonella thermotolerans TaxID=1070861 RepID=A0A3A4AA81_9ACTN|nr:DUF1330 domain-containing protein [Bailinhaonella thermotolerans]RJL22950.1 DUF1330 domain-containing protein [Bailinhaonella thermotolerans]
MTAYLLAHLGKPEAIHPDVLEYKEKVEKVLASHGGRFLVRGGAVEVREGTWPGDVILVEFPSMRHARDFYDSAAYQEILALRTDHLDGDLILVEGVEPAGREG